MATSATLHDLERLQHLYREGYRDIFLDNALHKIIDRQISRDEADLQRVRGVLLQFEQQYGLTSDEFWQRFLAGQMADTADFTEWNAFCKTRQRIESRPISSLEVLHLLEVELARVRLIRLVLTGLACSSICGVCGVGDLSFSHG